MPNATMKVEKARALATIAPSTWNAEKRTIDVVVSTGAAVRRYDWWNGGYYDEELVIEEGAIRMDRLNGGAAVLNTHGQWELGDQIGVVERAWIDGGKLMATLRLSAREDIAGIVQDISDGIIRNISVGYIPHVYETIENAGQKIPTKRAIDWEPTEVSFVPVPADPGAQARSEEQPRFYEVEVRVASQHTPAAAGGPIQEEIMPNRTMTPGGVIPAAPQPETRAASPVADPAAQPDVAQIRAEAAQSERTRSAEIRRTASVARVAGDFAEDLITRGVPLEEARAAIINQAAAIDGQTRTVQAGAPEVTAAEADKVRAAMQDAIILRANPSARLAKVDAENVRAIEVAREFRGMDLVDMARSCIESAGGRARGMSRREVAVAALGIDRGQMSRAGMHSTSDFPEILASTVGRTLRQSYHLAPRTFEPFCRRTTAPDFRQVARTQLSELTQLSKVKEGGEYKYLSFGDSAEKYSLSKYGGIIALTWESIINDDLSAFDRVPTAIAEEAAALEADLIYAILTGNPNMADTLALFEANTHLNYTAGGTAISDTSLGVARALMRKQTGPKGRVLNLTPDYLIVGPDREVLANKYTSAQFVAAKSADINPNFNTALSVIVDARISGNGWYMAASPARIDTIEYAYLEGDEGLFTEQRQGFEVDGLEIKARHVFACKAIDHRGLYYNVGA